MSKNLELQNCLLVNFRNFISIQLDDSNYVTWKFLVETLLKGCGLMKYVDGSFPCPLEYKTLEENGVASEIEHEYMSWVQNDSAVMSILAATLSSNALSFIVGSKTSKEIWCRLKEKYVDTSRYNIMKRKSSLYNIQKGSDCIEKYLLRVKEICDQLAVLEVSMDEEEIIESVLHGLPSEFAVIKAIIRIKTMNSSVSMTEVRSLLLIAEDEIDKSVKSIFEKLKTEMMEHGHSLNKFAPATTPTHVTNAKYDGAIQYNGAVNYGVPPLYFMSTSSSCISAPLNTSGYAQQPPLPQCAAFSSQAFDCKSHIEDLKLVHKANNKKYEAIIDDAKREIHLLTSTVEEFKTELQNAKADWELKELQLVDSVKHLEEENSSMEKEISRLLNLLKSTEKEACAIKEEEAQLKDSMKEIKSEVVCLQKALVEVKAENLKISGSIIDNESALRSVRHENEVLHIKETISHKKVEADLRIYRGRAGNKPISTSNRNNYDPVVCVGIPVSLLSLVMLFDLLLERKTMKMTLLV